MGTIINRRRLEQAARRSVAVALAWTLVAVAFAAQGHLVAAYRGTPQPWWPSLGYSLAIFSIWALLTPFIAAAVRNGRRGLKSGWRSAVAVAAGLPAVAALHVALFALIYWPVYSGGGAIPSRLAMAERMALRNLDSNGLFYLLVVGASIAWAARTRPAAAHAATADKGGQAPAEPPPLRVRTRGRIRLVRPAEIDWVGAAGDYCEVHAGGETHLVEVSLVALERGLPAGQFARIHRATLVRLDRIAEIRGLGRGDAMIRLENGTELRMSRRYRSNVAALAAPLNPARRPEESRSPIEQGAAP